MDERAELLAKAEKAVKEAIPAAEKDPNRPQVHFRAPAQWMNDPNGTIYHDGWTHVFYQFNPYGDSWGNMHWDHARSRDMVDWEMLPIAIPPSKSKGEDHVFSGSTFIDGEDKPTIFYTSIGDKRPPEQWIAHPLDKDWIGWAKPDANPVVSIQIHTPQIIDEWRDPFLLKKDGATYMLTGGRVDGKGAVALYRAENTALTNWEYVGILFRHPEFNLIECPNLALVDSKWVLLVSMEGRGESFVGTFEPKPNGFVAEHRATLHPGSYASQLLTDAKGRTVHFAWIRTDGTKGWNGCLTLPSILRVGRDGVLRSQPIEALQKLRGQAFSLANTDLEGEWSLDGKLPSGRMEIEAEIQPGTATEVRLKLGGQDDIVYQPSSQTLTIPKIPPVHLGEKSLKLHVYLDGGVVSVYADDGRVSVSAWLPDAKAEGISLTSEGGKARIVSLKAYALRAAKFESL